MSSRTVLISDDNRSAADALCKVLRREGYDALAVYDGQSAIDRIRDGGIEIVLTDLKMEPLDGMAVLRAAKAQPDPPIVLVFTGYGTVETAVQAMHLGALDFLTKPVTPTQLLQRLRELDGRGSIITSGDADLWPGRLGRQLALVAGVTSTVLLIGEPGSGRGSAAARIHGLGGGSDTPMVAIPRPDRADAEKLSASSAVFFPSVDQLNAESAQHLERLLDALPPPHDGGPRIFASARPGWSAPAGGALYYRLAVLVVDIPPLRDRIAELPLLIDRILEERSDLAGREAPRPTAAQLERLKAYHWPGNLREAAAVCERALVFGAQAYDLPDVPGRSPEALQDGFNLSRYLETEERRLLEQALRQSGGDRTKMSKLLGVERNTLRYKLNKYGLLDRT